MELSSFPADAYNSGASVPDTKASGSIPESIAGWRASRGIDVSKQIRIVKLAHMRYQHPDLDVIVRFLQDFGMHVVEQNETQVWLRGYGPDPYVYYAQKGPRKFLGGTFLVESRADLLKTTQLRGAKDIEELTGAPGGGSLVTVIDPEGVPVNFIHGQEEAMASTPPEKLIVNYETEKCRKNKFQRFNEGPAAVYKLGHFGLVVRDFDRQMKWYTENFNIVPTDLLYVEQQDGSKKDVAIFAHIDRGTDHTDHHTIFLSQGKSTHVHHASFEVHDFDTQHLGHQWLAQKGYKSVWGIGRHILGSQIFDYWWDPTGNMIEHYADGDLVNEHTPVGHLPAGDESLAVWGPDVPQAFLD